MRVTDSADAEQEKAGHTAPPAELQSPIPDSLKGAAEKIFGEGNEAAFQRWIEYWSESGERNQRLLEDFEKLALIDLDRRRVLDVGCGTGGLGPLVHQRGAEYVGGDYHRHVLRFAKPGIRQNYLQISAVSLPFRDASFDLIVCFDVIEHLVGGYRWQRQFLNEARRVLTRTGLILLTTPNFWYPYDAHTELYGPQFLPKPLADVYIRLRNPAFLKEHRSFREIQLMRPAELRRAIAETGLSTLHDLPCGLDSDEYRRLHPSLGVLTRLGLGWLPHAEFWMILGHRDQAQRLRQKLRKNWSYVLAQPDSRPIERFSAWIDFNLHPHGHQLLDGWYWYESDQRAFRWTTQSARALLETHTAVRSVQISGYTPVDNRLEVTVDGVRVGERELKGGDSFEVDYLLPFRHTACRLFEVEIRCDCVSFGNEGDTRELGLMIFSLGLAR